MALFKLNDSELHFKLVSLASKEREIVSAILRHLREVERRRLYSDFGCSSMFDYATSQLGYSEGQAHRRIQAMRLLKQLPQVEEKITSGELSLTNISQAQSLFNRVEKEGEGKGFNNEEKLKVLESLEDKSTREGQKELQKQFEKYLPGQPLQKDREKQITEDKVLVSMVIDEDTRQKLEDVRSLLGPQGATMKYNELINKMAELSVGALKVKRFGKKRIMEESKNSSDKAAPLAAPKVKGDELSREEGSPARCPYAASQLGMTSSANNEVAPLAAPKVKGGELLGDSDGGEVAPLVALKVKNRRDSRYIPRAVRYEVWRRDGGKCQNCSSQRNLQFDHIKPVGIGGESGAENLRLLCFHCNQRAAVKVFGVEKMIGNCEARIVDPKETLLGK